MTADVAEAEGLHQLKLSGTKFRKMLRAGEDIPEWCGLLLTQTTKDPKITGKTSDYICQRDR